MKVLVLGDIHGRLIWWDIIRKENPDLTVFLGDYTTTHDNISSEQQCSNLEDILNFKEKFPDKVVLLRGNHDNQMLGYRWAECSGYDTIVAKYVQSIKERFLKNTQWVYTIDKYLFSHAGISKQWLHVWLKDEKDVYRDNPSLLNDLEPSEAFGFTSSDDYDYYGTSLCQSCTWIRPTSLAQCAIDNYIQFVGHTPMPRVVEYKPEGNINPIYLCDTLPKEYVVLDTETGDINVKKTDNG